MWFTDFEHLPKRLLPYTGFKAAKAKAEMRANFMVKAVLDEVIEK
jgi:hypothetical protein